MLPISKTSVAAILSVAALLASGRAGAADEPVVAELSIEGTVSVPEDALRLELTTREGSPYDPRTLDLDLRRLWETGRYEMVRWREPREVEGGVALALILEERPVLREIAFEGNRAIGDDVLSGAVESIGLRAGRTDRFDRALAERAIAVIQDRYRANGYLLAEVGYETRVLDEAGPDGLPAVRLEFKIDEGEATPIRGYRIVGNRAFSAPEIRRFIFGAMGQVLEAGKKRGYEVLALRRPLGELERHYRDQGYLDATVELKDLELFRREVEGKVEKWLVVHVEIDEGALYKVGRVELNLQLPEDGPPLELTREELMLLVTTPEGAYRNHRPLASGSTYSQAARGQAVQRLQTELGHYGRIASRVEARDRFDLEGNVVDIVFDVVVSRPYTVRSARVRGNYKTKREVFLRELFYAGVRPGELVDARKLDLARRNITYTGLVKTEYDEATGAPRQGVEVRPIPRDDGTADLLVDVNETQTGAFMMGLSVNSNNEIAGQIELTQRNFNLFGFPRSWGDWTNAFTGAGQTLAVSAYFGTQQNIFSINFTEPYFLNLPLRLDVSGYDRTSNYSGYTEQRTGISAGLGRTWSLHPFKRRNLRLSATYRDEEIGIDPSDTAPAFIIEVDDRVRRAGLKLTYDSVDSSVRPTEGVLAEASWTSAGGILGGDADFAKSEIDLRTFRRLGSGVRGLPNILQFRARAKFAEPFGDSAGVPFYEKYFAGGIGTLRGFEYRTVGPSDGDTPTGGDFLTLATLEYTFPLEAGDSFRGLLFADIGNVWGSPGDFSFGELRKAVGFGLVIHPQGFPFPISLNWSQAIDPSEEDQTQVFSFTFGNMFFF